MNLRDKLKKFEKNQKPHRSKEEIEYKNKDAFNNQLISNNMGTYLKSVNDYKNEYKHGLYQIDQLKEQLDTEILFKIANNKSTKLNDEIIGNLLFIDTETTGLMGGTGTVSFLIGAGYFTAGDFVIEQYLMRDYDEEAAMLQDFKEIMGNHNIIVSFNGKSFDLPLIKTRLIMNRFDRPNYDYHLDLLHSARRLWSFLDSCSLKSLERNILNFERIDDVPGHLIPGLYFEFLENKNLELLAPVLEHNIYDILSLVTLFTHLKEIHLDNVDNLDSNELFHLGRIKEKEKNYHDCIDYLEASVENSEESTLKYRALKKLSWQYKRIDRYDKAAEIWKEMIDQKKQGIFPYVEMAKYLEHKKKNFKEALNYTNQAIEMLNERRIIINNFDKKIKNLEHRKERLIKKSSKI
ncbi:MAG TPA: ribonuclease H-like domain-containing protein [Halanaerobiales bacterium]|nr:ribonuclease H-like domain-containing protein [Halanaerobiales bacterium]